MRFTRWSFLRRTARQTVIFCCWPIWNKGFFSKDTDFAISRELGKGPSMLLLVSAGNVHNDELLALFARHEATICELLAKHPFLELTRSELIVHS